MSDRGGWALTTAQGVEIQIGRDHVVDKIRRFVSIYDKALKDQISNIARIDLRYPNGLAVAWRAGHARDGGHGQRRAVS